MNPATKSAFTNYGQRGVLLERYGPSLSHAAAHLKRLSDPCYKDLEDLIKYLDVETADNAAKEALNVHIRTWRALSLSAFAADGLVSSNRFKVLFRRAVTQQGYTRFTSDKMGFHSHSGRPVAVWSENISSARDYYERVVLPKRPTPKGGKKK